VQVLQLQAEDVHNVYEACDATGKLGSLHLSSSICVSTFMLVHGLLPDAHCMYNIAHAREPGTPVSPCRYTDSA
jgi:hypothetical protein